MKKIKIFLLCILSICFFNIVYVKAEENFDLTVKDSTKNSIKLTWSKYTDAKTYKVYRSTSENGEYKKLNLTTKTNYTDSNLTYGKKYYYYIKVYDSNNNKIYTSNKLSATVSPDKVTNLSASSVTKNSLKLTWKSSSMTGYKVYRSTDGSNWTKVATVTDKSFTNKKLSANKTYYYKVKSYKTVNGKKIYSPYSDILTVMTSPKTPSLTLSKKAYNKIKLNYSSNNNVTYQIYRSTNNKTWEKIDTTTNKEYIDNVIPGQKYYYKVRAYNSNSRYSSYSSIESKTVNLNTPEVLVVDYTDSNNIKSNAISITKIDGAEKYEIYYSTSKKGSFTKLTTIDNNTDSEIEINYYENKNIKKNYYYKVRAYITINDKKQYSSYSEIVYPMSL